ncbi:MAG: chromosomal replication initiator protein DnaA [Deltaproteobacteria bacterium]|nr:chromosomal replication initiator protein DnaA [Deltaproteobacteria bacterium]
MGDLHLIKEALSREVGGPSEKVLINQIDIKMNDSVAVVYCPNVFTLNYIQHKYKDLIVRNLKKVLGKDIEVEFDLKKNSNDAPEKDNNQGPKQMVLPTVAATSDGLNPRFTFEEFVVGRCNAFAYEAALAVSEEMLSRYNPLYFYSDIGLGKSHIAHAIGNKILRNHERKKRVKVRYTTANDFAQEYVYSIRNNAFESFKKRYSSNFDLFFIDDVHLLKNKEKTQVELCSIIDELMNRGKQVVFSGFHAPISIQNMDKGLKSRFSSGLVIDIKRPDKETRAKIVTKKAHNEGIELGADVVEFLSENIKNNIRELESAVLTIGAMSSLMKRGITIELVQELLEGTIERERKINIPFIQDIVARNFGLSKEDLVSPSRKRKIVYPRQIAIFLCRRYTTESLSTIAESFSRRHSSIIHSLEVIDTSYKANLKVKRDIDFLIERLDVAKP